MIMKENPLRSKKITNLEIGSKNNQPPQLSRGQKWRILCGPVNISITAVVIAVGVGLFYLFYIHVGGFARERLWLVFVLANLSCLLALSFVFRTCLAIHKRSDKNCRSRNKKQKRGQCGPQRAPVALRKTLSCYHSVFDIGGKYYFSKLYAAEIFEHIQQVYCLISIHLCLMPVEISSIVCCVLAAELTVNIWSTPRLHLPGTLYRIILMDIFTDVFCIVFPLSFSGLVLQIPMQLDDLLSIILYPTISLLSKLNDVWEEYLLKNLERVYKARDTRQKPPATVRQLRTPHSTQTLETQLDYFPKRLRYLFTTLNVGFLFFFVCSALVHLTAQLSANKCNGRLTKEVWQQCKLQVPFCQDSFIPKCDCAVLEMTNYSNSSLDESFRNLPSLIKLGIYTGALESLPEHLGDDHKRLVMLLVVGNKLKSLPDSVGNLKNLLVLLVNNNELEMLPTRIGNLKNLIYLDVFHNRLESLPSSIGDLHDLLFFAAYNNNLESVPVSVGKLKSLRDFAVYNNNLKSLPDSVGKLKNLQRFRGWNNSLTSLPETVGGMESLSVVDIRHNQLTNLPSSVNRWRNLEYLYLAGNPLCTNLDIPSNLATSKGLCYRQCSMDCPAIMLGNGLCDDNMYVHSNDAKIDPNPNSGCNTEKCNYDNGDCTR